MHGIEKRLLMRQLLEQGLSKSAVARCLGVHRRTIYNWIESGELERDPDDRSVQYGPRPPVPSMLDPYKDTIDARLAEYPELECRTTVQGSAGRGVRGQLRAGQEARLDCSAEDAWARGAPQNGRLS